MYIVYKYDAGGSKYWIKQKNNENGQLTPIFEISSPGGTATSYTGSAIANGSVWLYTSNETAKQQISLVSVQVTRSTGGFTEMKVSLMAKEEQNATITNDVEAEAWLRQQ